jgi:hypothetical protein
MWKWSTWEIDEEIEDAARIESESRQEEIVFDAPERREPTQRQAIVTGRREP